MDALLYIEDMSSIIKEKDWLKKYKGASMDKKLKIKYRKKENMYVVDYFRVKDKFNVRFELLSGLSTKHDMIVLLDSCLGMLDKKEAVTDYLDIRNKESFERIVSYLSDFGYEYKLREKERPEAKSFLGVSLGKVEMKKDQLIGVVVPKNKLTRELFELLMCTHDYMVGIDPIGSASEIIDDFANGKFDRVDNSKGLSHTLVDSHMMGYFYTSYPFEL